jgi:ERCC4-related helicase
VLDGLFDEMDLPIKWTIVYCSPQQIDGVMRIINRRRIIAHRFTMEEGTTPTQEYDGLSERDFLLREFGEGKYQALVAMKCLDEGVDVPPARTAILMASSGNQREYIQRTLVRMKRPYMTLLPCHLSEMSRWN